MLLQYIAAFFLNSHGKKIVGRIAQNTEEIHGTCLMTLNLPISFRAQYFAANNMIRDLIMKIGTRKSVLAQLIKIENVDLAQEKSN